MRRMSEIPLDEDAGLAPSIHVPPEAEDFRAERVREARLRHMRRGAVVVAALLHAAVIAAFLINWQLFAPPPSPPPPIPVALVMEPPPPPPAPAEAKPPAPPPPPPAPKNLQSGPDQKTTAPPQAEAKGPEEAPAPQPEQDKESSARAEAKTKPHPLAAPLAPKTKEAALPRAPNPTEHGSVDRAPGEEDLTGDPYLNALWARIEQHRTYPANAVGPLGLRLEGTVVYQVFIDPRGSLQGMRLLRSSGADILDDTAKTMILAASPFPPPPDYYPRGGVALTVTIHLFPGAG
jgi:protein TonB